MPGPVHGVRFAKVDKVGPAFNVLTIYEGKRPKCNEEPKGERRCKPYEGRRWV